jgi:hypothetical protein
MARSTGLSVSISAVGCIAGKRGSLPLALPAGCARAPRFSGPRSPLGPRTTTGYPLPTLRVGQAGRSRSPMKSLTQFDTAALFPTAPMPQPKTGSAGGSLTSCNSRCMTAVPLLAELDKGVMGRGFYESAGPGATMREWQRARPRAGAVPTRRAGDWARETGSLACVRASSRCRFPQSATSVRLGGCRRGRLVAEG